MDRSGLDLIRAARNPKPRVASALLLDTSASMEGEPIANLRDGLHVFYTDLHECLEAQRRLDVTDIAIFTFDGAVNEIQPFTSVADWELPREGLLAPRDGGTVLGQAVLRGLQAVRDRMRGWEALGLRHKRSWLFLITDGQPEHEDPSLFARAAGEVRAQQRRVYFEAIGVNQADMAKLEQLCPGARRLEGLNFKDLFWRWSSCVSGTRRPVQRPAGSR